ncbi:MAG: hypothetical protein QF721_11090 [Verrucomicrobiota bacterium]|nr:hypothetical protein [Verrucomicrobiota bacterium]MDP7049989.1 hypothetical protein [Verrucomicrobiota bacterium]
MNANWAEENLKTIRSLMEQAQVYRRAMAPLAIQVGTVGVAAAGLAQAAGWVGPVYFAGYWLGVAVASALAALILVRRQALKSDEKFWSPPTRRVAQAMLPMLATGLGLGLFELLQESKDSIRLTAFWLILYGGALHAAGFFMRRGIKLLGWLYMVFGLVLLFISKVESLTFINEHTTHWFMGLGFGVFNLAYGVYLKLTLEPLETE